MPKVTLHRSLPLSSMDPEQMVHAAAAGFGPWRPCTRSLLLAHSPNAGPLVAGITGTTGLLWRPALYAYATGTDGKDTDEIAATTGIAGTTWLIELPAGGGGTEGAATAATTTAVVTAATAVTTTAVVVVL